MSSYADLSMPRQRSDADTPLQRRLAAHVRRVYVKLQCKTQTELAEKTGINQGHLSSIMNGNDTVGLETLMKLSDASSDSIDWMFKHDPDPAEWWYRKGTPIGGPPRDWKPAQSQSPEGSASPGTARQGMQRGGESGVQAPVGPRKKSRKS